MDSNVSEDDFVFVNRESPDSSWTASQSPGTVDENELDSMDDHQMRIVKLESLVLQLQSQLALKENELQEERNNFLVLSDCSQVELDRLKNRMALVESDNQRLQQEVQELMTELDNKNRDLRQTQLQLIYRSLN